MDRSGELSARSFLQAHHRGAGETRPLRGSDRPRLLPSLRTGRLVSYEVQAHRPSLRQTHSGQAHRAHSAGFANGTHRVRGEARSCDLAWLAFVIPAFLLIENSYADHFRLRAHRLDQRLQTQLGNGPGNRSPGIDQFAGSWSGKAVAVSRH